MDKAALKQRLMRVFTGELQEHACALEADLLALAKAEPSGHRPLVDSLFRSAHTLKGAAHAVDLPQLEASAHMLESVFQQWRDQAGGPSKTQQRTVLATIDAIKAFSQLLLANPDKALPEQNPLTAEMQRLGKTLGSGDASMTEDPEPGNISSPSSFTAVTSPEATTAVSVRIATSRLDRMMALGGELLLARRRLDERETELAALLDRSTRLQQGQGSTYDNRADLLQELASRLNALHNDLRQLALVSAPLESEIMHARMMPLQTACEGLQREAHDIAAEHGKQVVMDIRGGDIEIERSLVDGLRDPLLQLVRNALAHGIETPEERTHAEKPAAGCICIKASLAQGRLALTFSDDGRGLDLDAIRAQVRLREPDSNPDEATLPERIFEPGFSTATSLSTLAGRGVGLDVVKTAIRRMRGSIRVHSTPGKGLRVDISLPTTLSLLRAVLVECGGQLLAFDLASVQTMQRIPVSRIETLEGRQILRNGAAIHSVFMLASLLGLREPAAHDDKALLNVVLLEVNNEKLAFVCDRLLTEQNISIKGLGPRLQGLRLVSGMSIQPDGSIALIIDVPTLARKALAEGNQARLARLVDVTQQPLRRSILVVDDSPTTRTLMKGILEAEGFSVSASVDGLAAWQYLQTNPVDLVVSDVEMPRMNGFELASTIRAAQRFRQLPLILVTALKNDKDKLRGMEVGADAYLVKSAFDQRELLATIQRLL